MEAEKREGQSTFTRDQWSKEAGEQSNRGGKERREEGREGGRKEGRKEGGQSRDTSYPWSKKLR
jgi:hypothetical protein